MPRSRDISRYAEEYWDLLQIISDGQEVEIPFESQRQARAFRSRWYAFTIGVASALQNNCKGLSPALADKVKQHQHNYGLVAVIETDAGLRFLHKSMTPDAQRIQAAIRRSAQAPKHVELSEEFLEASAQRILEKLKGEGQVVPTPAPATPEPAPKEERADPKVSPLPLGKPNPYY